MYKVLATYTENCVSDRPISAKSALNGIYSEIIETDISDIYEVAVTYFDGLDARCTCHGPGNWYISYV